MASALALDYDLESLIAQVCRVGKINHLKGSYVPDHAYAEPSFGRVPLTISVSFSP